MQLETGVLVAIAGVVFAGGGFVMNYVNFHGARDKGIAEETRETAQQSAKISTKLDHISVGVDNLRIDLKANEKHLASINERVVRVEESSKSAHRRIDGIQEVMKKHEN